MNGESIDLGVVFKAVRQHWRVFAGCLVAALSFAILACMMIPPRWNASATLRIGAAAAYGAGDLPFSKLLEPLAEVEARVRLPDFATSVFGTPSMRTMASTDLALFRKTVKAVALRGTGLVTVTAAGASRDKARRVMEATVASLLSAHNEKMQLVTQQLRARLEQLNEQVAAQQAELANLRRNLRQGGGATSKRGYAALLAQDLVSRLEMELRALERAQFTLRGLLSPPLTYQTELVDGVVVGDKPYFPVLRLFLMIAAIAGSVLGVLLCLFFYQRRLPAAHGVAQAPM